MQPGPTKRSSVVLGLGLALLASLGAFFVWQYCATRSVAYALRQYGTVQTTADLPAVTRFFTPQGERIVSTLLACPGIPSHPIYGSPRRNGDTCRIPFTAGRSAGELLLKQAGGWRLDNILLTRFAGHPAHVDLAVFVEPFCACLTAYADNSETQIAADDQHVTANGKKVLLVALTPNDSAAPDPDFVFTEPVLTGATVRFPVVTTDGGGELCVLAVRDGTWKFDDVVLVRAGPRTIDLRISYAIDHPFSGSLELMKSLWFNIPPVKGASNGTKRHK